MIELATINPFALPSATIADRKQMPKITGIYFVVAGEDKILYIGKTTNLRNRWGSHHRLAQFRGIESVRVSWLEISDGKLLGAIEDALINYFLPVYNGRKVLRAVAHKEGINAYVDISQWWPKTNDGSPLSVHAVYQQVEGTENHVTRHTLTAARDGKLENANIINLVKLARICSLISGDRVSVDDIIKIIE
jgi:hypothetical protein